MLETIETAFGTGRVFMDVESVRIGEQWPKRIDRSLAEASVLIALIGPQWVKMFDPTSGQRLLDDPEDWVRREIEHAIAHKLPMIPLLVQGAVLPDVRLIPPSLAPLFKHVALEVRETSWAGDCTRLVERLEESGFKRIEPVVQFPSPTVNLAALDTAELGKALKRLPGWSVVTSPLPGQASKKRTELMKAFEFRSFHDAIHFMSTAARFMWQLQHHPRWENLWRTVTVYLTTWDIGHKPSSYDVQAAAYLNRLFDEYQLTPRELVAK
jgi:pterin-4a-carbinolamine dehydratase